MEKEVNINPIRLRQIIRDERMALFLKKHGIKKENDSTNQYFEEECHSYGYEWTEEELQQYADDAGLSFQIKHAK